MKIIRVEAADGDEMWRFIGSKSRQHWIWHAINHHSGKVLAYVLGLRKDKVFKRLKPLLKPLGSQRFCTDDWGAYARDPLGKEHVLGKDMT